MKLVDKVMRMVSQVRNREQDIWRRAASHSSDYRKALVLTVDDMKAIERGVQARGSTLPTLEEIAQNGFLKFIVENEEFTLHVKHVCGGTYGADWMDMVLAICTSDMSLNDSVGEGTILITAVSSEWHEKIVRYLEENNSETGIPPNGGSKFVH